MGTFRAILALLVVCSHLRPLTGAPAGLATGGALFAVKAFFIVSGFYMALVLSAQYRHRPRRDFYLSRLSRLLPLYWIVGLATVAAEYFLVPPGQKFYPLASPLAYGAGLKIGTLPLAVALYAIVAVVTMLGLDTGQWLGFGRVGGALGIWPNFDPGATSVMALSPVPPGWSLGIELLFYLLVPFIFDRSLRLIALLAAGSLAFRFGLAYLGFGGDPWSRTLFPSELFFFLMGIAAFRLYRRLPAVTRAIPHIGLLRMAPITVALIISPIFNHNPQNLLVATLPYLLVALGTPFLFEDSKSSALDARIGDLSYPIYIGHMFALGMLQLLIPAAVAAALGTEWLWLACNLVATLIAAVALDLLFTRPIDRWRTRFGARAAVATGAPRPADRCARASN